VSAPGGATSTREARLYAVLADYESILVAYSGGVDSAYLAWAANRARPGQVLCVTADSPSYPRRHRDIAEAIARQFHLPHEFVHTSELDRPEYRANPVNRCYYCKHELYTALSLLARCQLNAGEMDAGVASLEEALKVDPNSTLAAENKQILEAVKPK